ncbi:hypothetical protein [Asaia siamensis]|uniref:DUF4410 domain-containing protein n=1 Tax=Asaia siamensis TaxID=110479 RepID=A0ABQ1M7V0_9PROT|nr:hypothetical protein [Asaia siamensis]GBR06213.1 hypothetical protein AA0323_1310 [Asaia siamensis NRIC 0323]GGC34834.1 hypothetical protein GCM10007207_20420 [Asaia siamensis]
MSQSPSRVKNFLRFGSLFLALGSISPLLTACGDSEPQSFAPLDYNYLSKMHLNVAHIEIVDTAPPGSTPGDISGKAPTTPQQALEQMARDRLIASGTEGSGTFTITKASILHAPGGTLLGELEAHVDLSAPSGGRAGYALAHITRSLNPGDKNPESPAVLYDLTSQMMQDMNVELEFQIKKSLHDWLVDASGAPLQGAIQQQDIGPGAPLAAPSISTANAPAATAQSAPAPAANSSTALSAAPAASAPAAKLQGPDAIFPLGDDDAPAAPAVKSPKPGVLSLPSGHS